MGSFGAPELLIILVILLVIFGGAKLPKLARSLGQAQKEFKTGLSDGADGTSQPSPPPPPPAAAIPPPPPAGPPVGEPVRDPSNENPSAN
jgi:sec-independent protein translocase protein TatA